jgi:hypothetical protein
MNMISSEEGLGILRKWKRERTVLSFISFELSDFWSERNVRIRKVESTRVAFDMAGSPADTQSGDSSDVELDLEGAEFDKAVGPEEVPEDVPLPDAEISRFGLFLFVRLRDGLPVLFAAPVSIN